MDESLNLVFDVETPAGVLHIHSMPVSREVYKANYKLLGIAHAEVFGHGTAYGVMSGRVNAALELRNAARKLARSDDATPGVDPAAALLAEIARQTHVLAPGASGYEPIPVEVAVARGTLDPEDWEEVEAALVFFTLVCSTTKRAERARMAKTTASIMGARAVSLSATEFTASLRTSTPVETSEAPKAALQHPR